jgi:hypothetical protein
LEVKMASQVFIKLMERAIQTHIKKSHDYAQEGSPFSNFDRAALIASWFNSDKDKTFANLIGVKLARLAELLNGKTPLNESIDDNFMDATNYMGLWGASVISERSIAIEVNQMSEQASDRPYSNEYVKRLEDEVYELRGKIQLLSSIKKTKKRSKKSKSVRRVQKKAKR